MTTCIDLSSDTFRGYKLGVCESYRAETGSGRNCNSDPWNWQLLGVRGHVCPWGGDRLAVCIRGPVLAKRLSREPWVEFCQLGEGECNAVFHVRDFERAIPYAKLYYRKPLEGEALEKAQEAARKNFGV